MGFATRTASLLRNLFRGSRVERELDDEMSAYVDLLAHDKQAPGMSPAEAPRGEPRLDRLSATAAFPR